MLPVLSSFFRRESKGTGKLGTGGGAVTIEQNKSKITVTSQVSFSSNTFEIFLICPDCESNRPPLGSQAGTPLSHTSWAILWFSFHILELVNTSGASNTSVSSGKIHRIYELDLWFLKGERCHQITPAFKEHVALGNSYFRGQGIGKMQSMFLNF